MKQFKEKYAKRLESPAKNKKGKICRRNFMPSAKDVRLEFLPTTWDECRAQGAWVENPCAEYKSFLLSKWKAQKDSWSLGWKVKSASIR